MLQHPVFEVLSKLSVTWGTPQLRNSGLPLVCSDHYPIETNAVSLFSKEHFKRFHGGVSCSVLAKGNDTSFLKWRQFLIYKHENRKYAKAQPCLPLHICNLDSWTDLLPNWVESHYAHAETLLSLLQSRMNEFAPMHFNPLNRHVDRVDVLIGPSL